jgi:hypothetical protein
LAESPPKTPEPIRLPRWKVALFSGFILFLVLGTLEFAARLYLRAFRGFDGEHLVQHEFDPYKNILPTRNYVDTRGITHNSQGFRRVTDVVREKPEGTIRVFLMGASTGYGTGGLWPHVDPNWPILHDSVTISAYLERSLQKQFPENTVEVINAAIASTWTHHELIYLNQTILGFDPDLIVFLDGFNDFFHIASDHEQFASYAYGEQAHTIMGPPTLRSLFVANFWWFYRTSAAVHVSARLARDLAQALRNYEQYPVDVDEAMAALKTTFAANALPIVERNVLLTEAAGVEAVFVLQPLLILERDRPGLSGIEKELFDYNVSSYLPNWEEFMNQAVAHTSGLAHEAVERRGGNYLDANGIFRDATVQIFTDYAHLTPSGNRILSEFIEAEVVPLLQARIEEMADSKLDLGPS